MNRGDRFVVYATERPAKRLFGEVTRVAKDGSWADIRVCTWAVMWTKRQPLPFRFPYLRRDWDQADIDENEQDWAARRAEEVPA